MKTPEIYMEVDTRELSLTDGDVLRERLYSKAFFIYRTKGIMNHEGKAK